MFKFTCFIWEPTLYPPLIIKSTVASSHQGNRQCRRPTWNYKQLLHATKILRVNNQLKDFILSTAYAIMYHRVQKLQSEHTNIGQRGIGGSLCYQLIIHYSYPLDVQKYRQYT